MPTKNPPRKKKPSFIEQARRTQIIGATIETIATQGFGQTSLAEIAKELDITKGAISYHFESKDELIKHAFNTLLELQNVYIKQQVDEQSTALDKLQAYLKSSFEYMQAERNKAVATWELWGSFDSVEAKREFSATVYDPCRQHLEKILNEGQASGEFRAFPTLMMASLIQAAIDGIMLQWIFDPAAVDLNACRDELNTMLQGYVSEKNK
jgi:TetR/AcrR family fatty acid metabolism transcriptional regulator